MVYFNSNFTKHKNGLGKILYRFKTTYTPSNENDVTQHPFCVGGEVIYASTYSSDLTKEVTVLPEETQNPTRLKAIFEQWLKDCTGAFVKPPTIEKCLANVVCHFDTDADCVSIYSDEEDKDWQLQWMPTLIEVYSPTFTVYWAPCYKTQYTRPANEQIALDEAESEPHVEVQNPEKTYTILPQATRLVTGEWLQELPESNLPLSDSPALRLDVDLEAQKEKMRRRIRDARIRAKLARYRAERLANRFEAKFGEYPSEDEEEAQTEAETEGDE